MKQPSPKALELILEQEVGGGESYYNKFLQGPTWPGGASGVTLAIGIDCGYYSKEALKVMFNFLPDKQLTAILNSAGFKGAEAKNYVNSIKPLGIKVPWDKAEQIFKVYTWPKFANIAEKTYPGLDDLCDNAYGAIVSLVFNRGSSLVGDSRSEMRKIKELIPKKDYKGIAKEFRNMKRLWQGKGLDGLLTRREAEAVLVESCA